MDLLIVLIVVIKMSFLLWQSFMLKERRNEKFNKLGDPGHSFLSRGYFLGFCHPESGGQSFKLSDQASTVDT